LQKQEIYKVQIVCSFDLPPLVNKSGKSFYFIMVSPKPENDLFINSKEEQNLYT